jgi:hypothetical protein
MNQQQNTIVTLQIQETTENLHNYQQVSEVQIVISRATAKPYLGVF